MNTGSSSTTVEVLNSMERSSFSTNGQDIMADVVDTLYEDSREDRIVAGIDRIARLPADLDDDQFIPTSYHVSNEQDDETLGVSKSKGQVSQEILEDEVEDFEYVGATPIGSKFWYPNVHVSLKTKVGDYYESVEVAEATYRKYADQAGFDVRLSNKKTNKLGVITTRFYVCSKTGMPPNKYFDSLDVVPGDRKHRNSNIKRTGCGACMKIHFVKERERYEVYKFIEVHNHELFTPDEMIFSRSRRQMQYADRKTVYHGTTSKIGITKSHRMRNALKGGLECSSSTARDYQNSKRDMNKYVGIKDTQMLINKLENRRKVCPDYFFEYKRDDKELISIFWADETARLNFKMFGDALSFDATYRTNEHAMVFVPFVAVDNHKKSVVVGAALINGETVPNYTWILKAFMKAHGQQPRFVITDQCATMKQAIPIAFPNSKHRLCMWHITKKLPSKISAYLAHSTAFQSDFKKLVWDVHLEPVVFEEKWNDMIEEYGLRGDDWFEEMYRIRESWIPAYYKDCHMSGLMKTTSRSESINAFFNVYAHFHNDLVRFISAFDNAIDEQRVKHGSLKVTTKCSVPRLVSPCDIEAQAAEVYTRTIFLKCKMRFGRRYGVVGGANAWRMVIP
ncbi:hypothetical protein L6452_42727 [Arctium lappa]|uniref:Uncharacterized protein n=1 Tax=Arctium lappa TaxID=4217 RepID=A0ACB8XJ20_ARCLA|nr:hypothetical protein L6452_42727 [Arctium lappa]